ncbi:calcium/calmodulin-regulated receptor-like kinase 1 [Senna tora]|uniref:Calcium/calmodulin-regulated receptor-like kinase 1 n=1 Tax=Senna tora TaxID=362788 RepID=A0A835C6Y2_9FABA|nr:calcium/calmodulin-regulated receptor-like kinase 1 [Senna tora]
MKGESIGLIIGISIGVVIGVVLAISALFCFKYHRKRSLIGNSSSRRAATIPIRANGADSCTILSDSTIGPESPVKSGRSGMSFWVDGFKKKKGQHMLVYVYMSKGSLASHLYCEENSALSWDLRVYIALDVARGLEYLHDGAAMNTDGKVGWEEIVDARLEGKFNIQELNEVAALAYKCINRAPRKRPSMRDIVQVLTRILKSRQPRSHHKKTMSATVDEVVSIDGDHPETKITVTDHQREESMDSAVDVYEV